MIKNKIAFYCAHSFGLYGVLSIYKSYDFEKNDVYIITHKKYYQTVKNNFNINDNNIYFIDDYQSRLGIFFTDWFRLLFVSKKFSELYEQRKNIKFSLFKVRISSLFKFFNIGNDKVNTTYSKIVNIFYRLSLIKTFPANFNKIYVVTKVYHPYLITPFEDKMHLIIESWDHPAKEPFLLNPRSSESWNYSLNLELIKYQFYENTNKGIALKFRYIKEYNCYFDSKKINDKELKDIEFIQNNNVAIYPMCTSSEYFAFSEELLFVKDLAKKLEKEKMILYVRPYPLAPLSDILALKEISNLKVGIGNKIKNGLEVFDENHMLHKYLLIKYSNYIINLGTTFVFDAALVDSNCIIIQLKIDKESYGDLGWYSRGTHITKYLHNKDAKDFNEFEISDATYSFKNYLIDWLNN